MNTQPRKQRAGWLSLGWLTDAKLVAELIAYKQDVERLANGTPIPMSYVVKDLLRRGLEAAKKRR